MHKLTPCLWFEKDGEAAARHYVSLFEGARIGELARHGAASAEASGRPKGSVMTVTFELAGLGLMALNGGPAFRFSPATSFFVSAATRPELDSLWARLAKGGKILMELDKFPFSDRFGWLEDRYGLSWQRPRRPRPEDLAVPDVRRRAPRAGGGGSELLRLTLRGLPDDEARASRPGWSRAGGNGPAGELLAERAGAHGHGQQPPPRLHLHPGRLVCGGLQAGREKSTPCGRSSRRAARRCSAAG